MIERLNSHGVDGAIIEEMETFGCAYSCFREYLYTRLTRMFRYNIFINKYVVIAYILIESNRKYSNEANCFHTAKNISLSYEILEDNHSSTIILK